MLGWLILALVIGTLISFSLRTFVLRDRPGRQLERALGALGARVGGVVDIVGNSMAGSRLSDHTGRQLHRRVSGVSETALMVESQLEDFDLHDRWPGIEPDELTLRLFDLELATEHLAGAGRRAAAAPNGSDGARDELIHALSDLRLGLRSRERTDSLWQAGQQADRVRADPTAASAVRALALAVSDLVRAIAARASWTTAACRPARAQADRRRPRAGARRRPPRASRRLLGPPASRRPPMGRAVRGSGGCSRAPVRRFRSESLRRWRSWLASCCLRRAGTGG